MRANQLGCRAMDHRLSFRHLRSVSIMRVLAERGVALRQTGARLTAACPIHGGDNPNAFVVHPERNLWYCFTGCARGGDVIDLVRLLDRCDHYDAARYLLTVAQSLPATPSPPPPAAGDPPWRPYTRTLHLDPHDEWLARKGIRPETARSFGVGRYDGPGFLSGCIGVRLHDEAGFPIGYAGRRLNAAEAVRLGKWKLPTGLPKSGLLYGLHRARPMLPTARLVLVECPWAVLRLAQLRVPAVALLGTHLSEHHIQLLRLAHRLALLFDGDPAGRRAGARAATTLAPSHPDTVTFHLPDGLDPDDLSDQDLHSLLARPLPSIPS